MMLSFLNIASGSKGNATIIYSENTVLLLDAGISLKKIKEGFALIQKNIQDLQGILITHEHSDHIAGLKPVRKYAPVYASEGTVAYDEEIIPGVAFSIGDILVLPFPTSHDANNPIGFLFSHGDKTLFYMTDNGYVDETIINLVRGSDYMIIESNHDIKMLRESNRPASLIRRIRGKKGHLSNRQCADCLFRIVGEKTKGIYLAHLSEECNKEELALQTARDNLKKNPDVRPDLELKALRQREMTFGGDQE